MDRSLTLDVTDYLRNLKAHLEEVKKLSQDHLNLLELPKSVDYTNLNQAFSSLLLEIDHLKN
jgi:hypothetical protein